MRFLQELLDGNTEFGTCDQKFLAKSFAETNTKSFAEYLKQGHFVEIVESKKQQAPETKADHKHINDTLRSKKGGRHFSAKTDYKRSHQKRVDRSEMRD